MRVRIRPTETINFIALAVLTGLAIILRDRLTDFRGMLLGKIKRAMRKTLGEDLARTKHRLEGQRGA